MKSVSRKALGTEWIVKVKEQNLNLKIGFSFSLAVLLLVFCARKTDLQIGVEAIKKGEYQKAIKSLNRAITNDSLNPEVNYNLCLSYAHLDSINQSFRWYLKLFALDDNLKNDLQLKTILANFLNIEPYPSSPIPMKKIMHQFKGSPAPDNELIAVAAARLDIADIYLIKYDGTILKKITKGGMNTDPVFSPTGGQVIYVSDRDGDEELYLYDLKTEETINLTNNKAQDFSPSFSPDGKEVVFVTNRDGAWEIYKINLQNKRISRLTSNKFWDGFPEFSQDGKWLVFSSKRDESEDIYIMEENGTETRILYSTKADETDPHLIGENLFFRSNQDGEWEIYQLNLKNKLLIRLTNNPYPDWNPRVSRDGTRILLSRKIKNRWQLYFINLSLVIPTELIVQAIRNYGSKEKM